nr:hypothetical protein [Methanobacterium formicicum]
MVDSAVESFGLACDYNGKIIEIFYDNLGLGSFKIGEPFLKIGDEGSQEKAQDFIEKIKKPRRGLRLGIYIKIRR